MNNPGPLTPRLIAHFGEMGGRRGINRTVGRICALLYVQGKPLDADEIAEYLSFSRANRSVGLKELQSWRLVKFVHQSGDRREYFEPPKNIWDIFKALVDVRNRFRFKAPDGENRDIDNETHHDDHPTSE